MLVTLKQNIVPPPLFLDNHQLDEEKNHKHVGLIINQNLSWEENIQSITEKASKMLNIISKLGNILERKSLTIMYNSFIHQV